MVENMFVLDSEHVGIGGSSTQNLLFLSNGENNFKQEEISPRSCLSIYFRLKQQCVVEFSTRKFPNKTYFNLYRETYRRKLFEFNKCSYFYICLIFYCKNITVNFFLSFGF